MSPLTPQWERLSLDTLQHKTILKVNSPHYSTTVHTTVQVTSQGKHFAAQYHSLGKHNTAQDHSQGKNSIAQKHSQREHSTAHTILKGRR
jgi:hypothetical protein